jgi:hypothetical protein
VPRFRVIHRYSNETWEVEANCIEDANKVVGWPFDVCRILRIIRGPIAEITPPKVAVQILPPKPGSIHICSYCNFTMVEVKDQDFWWQCPSCDRLYHEWENKFYEDGEIF